MGSINSSNTVGHALPLKEELARLGKLSRSRKANLTSKPGQAKGQQHPQIPHGGVKHGSSTSGTLQQSSNPLMQSSDSLMHTPHLSMNSLDTFLCILWT